MSRSFSVLMVLVLIVAGCGGPSAKDKYDAAVRDLEQVQARLDGLRPAYDAARQEAANAVCKEIAGVTPEESAAAALEGLGNVLNQTAVPPAEDATKDADGRKGSDLDKTIDNLIAAQQDVQEKQAALTAPVAKANEVMAKIKTPGTPEAKRYEEKFAAMPEVQAYERQQKRVEEAQKAVDAAKAEMK